MTTVQFKGFAGVRLEADHLGDDDAPAVLLLHGSGQTRESWRDVASALQLTGRQVINLDLRGHGGSEWPEDGRYQFDSFVEDLKLVLAQLPARPVIVASTFGGWVATAALGEDGAHLASVLILADSPAAYDPGKAQKVSDALRRSQSTSKSAKWDTRFLDAVDADAAMARVVVATAKVSLPVLYVRSANSALDDSQAALTFAAGFPQAEFAEVEGGGHLVVSEQADQFNALLLDFLERNVPLAPPEYREGSDARTFRDALGCFATGVTVVTAMTEEGLPIGLTANSFTSVSLDPPLLLVCIANNAGSAPVLREAKQFAVNVLQIGQQPTSNRFAGKGEDRFSATPWETGSFGTPVLSGSLASFECARDAVHDGGDHFILVGRVQRAIFEPRRDPLLYFKGKYRRLHFA